jgi:hypothetical protein
VTRKARAKKPRPPRRRFSIGEWYGTPLTALTAIERRRFANIQPLKKAERPTILCPFQPPQTTCKKKGGVCSLRLYEENQETKVVSPVEGILGLLRTTCPARFEEEQVIYRWVGRTVLGCEEPLVRGEIGFLETPPVDDVEFVPADVGRIDRVLVVPDSKPLAWCALEAQAVYFQGKAMRNDFAAIRDEQGDGLVLSPVTRRPDYRSSGPKRLMPQLQIKVPSLRRWGKKMAVIVDKSFFQAMGKMRTVQHISNCDVAWFVIEYIPTDTGRFRLVPDEVYYTTLEDSVEGLTAGVPVSLEEFERRIVAKLQTLSSPLHIPTDQQLVF